MEYWIYLQLLLGYGCINARKVIENIRDITKLPQMADNQLLGIGVTQAQLEGRSPELMEQAKAVYNQCLQNHIIVIPYNDERFPNKLRQISNPPIVIYIAGAIPDFDNRLSVAVIGTRKISELGCSAAFSLSARLALAGALIISGGAIGGDTYAHSGAMAVAAPTVNVTGGGLLSGYLKTNKKLRGRVVRGGGTLLSEFIPDYTPDKRNSFHLRNRIIAALSDGVVVIEAPKISGTFITAQMAADYGKEVFAFPGDKESPEFEGCRLLIADGAIPVQTPEDILSRFPQYTVNYDNMRIVPNRRLKELYKNFLNEQKSVKKQAERKKSSKPTNKTSVKPKFHAIPPTPTGLTPDCAAVYNALSSEEIFADEIVLKTNLSTEAVLTALTMLEIKGLAVALPGSRYRLKID